MKSKAAQPLKFLAVGTAGYVLNLLAFAALYGAGSAYFAASAAAYLVANALMYLGNRYYTFRLGRAPGHCRGRAFPSWDFQIPRWD